MRGERSEAVGDGALVGARGGFRSWASLDEKIGQAAQIAEQSEQRNDAS